MLVKFLEIFLNAHLKLYKVIQHKISFDRLIYKKSVNKNRKISKLIGTSICIFTTIIKNCRSYNDYSSRHFKYAVLKNTTYLDKKTTSILVLFLDTKNGHERPTAQEVIKQNQQYKLSPTFF